MKFVNPELAVQLLRIAGLHGDNDESEGIPSDFLAEMYAAQLSQMVNVQPIVNMFGNMLKQAEQEYVELNVLSREELRHVCMTIEDKPIPLHLKKSSPALYDLFSIGDIVQEHSDLYHAWDNQMEVELGYDSARIQMRAQARHSPLASSLGSRILHEVVAVGVVLDAIEGTPYARWSEIFKSNWGDDFGKTWNDLNAPLQVLRKYAEPTYGDNE